MAPVSTTLTDHEGQFGCFKAVKVL